MASVMAFRRAAPSKYIQQQVRQITTQNKLTPLIDQFQKDVDRHLVQNKSKQAVFATAWLATDNVFVALLKEHHPEVLKQMHLLAINTMHLFPETLTCARDMQTKYGKDPVWYRPLGCESEEDFLKKFGDANVLDSADFDFASKVEPFQRALQELKKEILITGRRQDQGNVRISLDAWEDGKQIFNPLAKWEWSDITAYVDQYGVPVNGKHYFAYRSSQEIPVEDRHKPGLPWEVENLKKPYWQATPEEINREGKFSYIYKSFGDTHTTAPVFPHESERAGRFVNIKGKTECGIHTRTALVGAPHGGELVDLCVRDATQIEKLVAETQNRTLELNERQACDVWSLAHGAFSPLRGFMNETTYNSVVSSMRLPEKQLFGLPVTLDVTEKKDYYKAGEKILLRYNGQDVAVLEIDSCYKPNKVAEAHHCYLTTSTEHPNVENLMRETGDHYLGGKIHALNEGPQFTYQVKTPREVRATLPKDKKVIAFQNRNPIHRAHFELLVRAQKDVADSILLVHPTCGPTQPGDIDGNVRIETYKALEEETKEKFPGFRWAYLPYSMKMAGPREAIQHMMIRKNFGATHFIIGRDMAGTKSTLTGKDFYGPYDAQKKGEEFMQELNMEVVTYENMVYVGPELGYLPESEVPAEMKVQKLSGTEFRRRLKTGEEIPEWFSFSSVIGILRKAGDQAFC